MRKISSIFSFNIRYSAIAWTIASIIAIETVLAVVMPLLRFDIEVDGVLYDIERRRYDSDVVVLSDSLGRQMKNYDTTKYPEKEITFLSTTAAIEIVGQYYLTKRYLKRNKKPKSIIFYGRPFMGFDLNQIYTEHYVQRCFTNNDEIEELILYKGLKFGLPMLAYKLLPSFRYRVYLQERSIGIINTDRTGVSLIPNTVSVEQWDKNLEKHYRRLHRQQGVSFIYLEKLAKLLYDNNIDFYVVLSPTSITRARSKDYLEALRASQVYYPYIRARYPNFKYSLDTIVYPDDLFLADKVHFTAAGLKQASMYWKAAIKKVIEQTAASCGASARN